jgi:hypothetical protein
MEKVGKKGEAKGARATHGCRDAALRARHDGVGVRLAAMHGSF